MWREWRHFCDNAENITKRVWGTQKKKKIRWTLMTQRKISVTYEATNLSYLCEFIGHCCCSLEHLLIYHLTLVVFTHAYTRMFHNMFFFLSFELIHTLFSLLFLIDALMPFFVVIMKNNVWMQRVSESWDKWKKIKMFEMDMKSARVELFNMHLKISCWWKRNHTFCVLFY